MEREPIRPNQGEANELTGQGQTAYPNSMAENNGEQMGANPDGSSDTGTDRIHPLRTSRADASSEAQQRAREELLRLMGGEPSDPMTRALLDEIVRVGGNVPNIDRGEDRSFRAQMNPDGDGPEEGLPLEDNQFFAPEEQAERVEFNRENPRGRRGNQGGNTDDRQSPADRQAMQEQAERIAAKRGKQKVIDILIDPVKRNEYFNQIYAQVDSRPYDFWNQAFDQLNDGADEYFFNQIVINGTRGNWDEILTSSRFGSNIPTRAEIQAGLDAWNTGHNQEKTLDQLSQDLSLEYERFQKERQVRKTLHDVNAILYLPTVKADQLFENMQQFDSASGDLALAMPGVRDMMGIYESVLREIMAENGGFLPDNLVRGKPDSILSGSSTANNITGSEADRRTKERFKKLVDAGLIMARAKSPTGETWERQMEGGIAQNEINRIFTIARGMMIMEERLISLAAESKYPLTEDGKPSDVRYASGFLQDVVQSTSTYAHLLAKWGITDEAIAAYLIDGKHDETIARYFKGWNPKDLEAEFKKFKANPEMIYESLDKTFYLARRNPNRAGDIYTWISWRGHLKADVPSMMQDYLQSGQRRMGSRLGDQDIRARFEANRRVIEERWRQSHPGEDLPRNLDDLLKKEYENWSGTGFRFELLRNSLAKHSSHGHEEQKEFNKAFRKAQFQIGRMVDLQPQRIYLVSKWVRDRVGRNLTEGQKQTLSQDLENLSMVEIAFLNSREKILDKGKTFDTLTIEDMNEFYELAIPDEAARQRAKDLAAKIRSDFNNNAEEYWKEFVYQREATHGYVLWSGDTPADEYSFSALGATGGFVRRARDNANQAKATEAEVAMLDNLKNMNHPDQVISALFGIFQHIDHYDRGKAKMAIAEKAEGLIKFYKASYKTDLPIVGFTLFKGGKSSYAKMMYGGHAMAWEASDIRYFVEKMEHARMITEEDAHRLLKYTGGEKKHIAFEEVVGTSQLFALAMFLLAIELSAKEGLKSQDLS